MKKSDKTNALQLLSRILPAFFLLTVFAASGWGQDYFIDFETNTSGNKGGYATGTVDLSGKNWEMTQALIGTLDGDKKFGDRSARMRRSGDTPGEMVMLENKPNGIGSISFYYARYGTETAQPNLTIQYSTNDGVNWIDIATISDFPADLTQYSADINIEGDVRLRFITDLSGTNQRRLNIDNILVTDYVPADQVATPSFDPGTGTFYDPFEVEITTATEDATIRYSFDSDDPEAGTWVVYDDGNRPNISETTTIWAYAEKAGMDDSSVASAIYTFPTEVASIEALQDIAEIGGLYRITGEVFMSYQNDSRNQKYFQDELDGGRGIKIDDENGYLITALNIGDGITNLTGTISNFNRMIQFLPIENQSPESANSTGNTLIPLQVTLSDIIDQNNTITVAGQEISVYQALLIKVEDLQFEQAGDFDSGTNFGELPISDPTASLVDIDAADFGVIFRVEYSNLEYNGDPIPQIPLTLTAIVDQRLSNARIFARDWDDFDIPDPIFFVSPSSLTGLDYLVEEGPSEAQSFQLTGSNLDGTDVTVTAPDDFEISQIETTGFGSSITLTAYDGSAETIWVRLEADLNVDDYSGNVTISGGGANDAQVAVSGEVTGPLVTEVPFETKFEIDEQWGGSGSGYQERWYEEGGWYFHSSSAIRGTSGEAFGGSAYSFRDTGGFTIKNLAEIDGMTGFSMQLRNWMGTAASPADTERDIEVSLNGGVSWETIHTLSQEWFNEFQVYQEFVYFFASEQNLDAEELHVKISGGSAGSSSHRINIGQFRALDEEPPPPPAIADPEFNPPAGTYFEDQTVFISNFGDYDPGVTVYYTTNGDSPDDQSDVYDDVAGILLEDGNGPITLKAIAIDNGTESNITSAVYTFPINVDDIEQLRLQILGGLYRVDNPAIFIGGDSFRNTKFFQDDSGFGIQIDDPGTPVVDTDYDIGDQVAELIGTLGQFQNQLRFSPSLDPGDPIDTGVEIIPVERTLDELTQDDQSRLVIVYDVEFEDGDGVTTFGGGGSTTNITDPSITGFTGLYRNVFGGSDITGSIIPDGPVNITGVIQENDDGLNLTARSLDDFEAILVEDPVLNASPTTLADLDYIEGFGPSAAKPFELTGANLDPADATITVNAPANFEVSLNNVDFSASVSVDATGGNVTQTVYVRLEEGLNEDTYSGNVEISGGGASRNVAVSGSVTSEPPGLPYVENFEDLVSEETLPFGWTVDATGSAANKLDFSPWADGGNNNTGVKYSTANANVLGYQHTGTTGIFTATLLLINNTGSIIEDLYVSYLGMVERTGEGRSPEWTVNVNGTIVSELSYSTSSGVNEQKSFLIEGIDIPENSLITITWSSERGAGTGSSKQIGIGDVFIDTEAPSDPTLAADPDNLENLNYVHDEGPSTPQSFELSGTDLDGSDVTVTAPANFEVSDAADGTYNTTLTLPAFDGSETDVWVLLAAGLAAGDYDGNVTIAGGDASDVTVSVSGKVVSAFAIPYANNFRTTEDYDTALIQGFDVDEAEQVTTAGGYLRISLNGYLETPTIDFTGFDGLEVSMSLTTFGGNTGQEIKVQASSDNGATYATIKTIPVPGSYETFTAQIDLRGDMDVANGKIRIIMTDGTTSTRLRDLTIEEYEPSPLIENEDTGETYASIQEAVNDASPGQVIIIPAGTYTGDVIDNVGVIFSPGTSPGCVTINGDLTAIAATTFEIDIFGDNACTQFDRISVTGTLTLGGATLDLTMGSYNPPDGKNYTIITYGTLVGTFGAIQMDKPVDFSISYTGGQIRLSTPMDPTAIPIAPWVGFLLFGLMGAFVLRKFRR